MDEHVDEVVVEWDDMELTVKVSLDDKSIQKEAQNLVAELGYSEEENVQVANDIASSAVRDALKNVDRVFDRGVESDVLIESRYSINI